MEWKKKQHKKTHLKQQDFMKSVESLSEEKQNADIKKRAATYRYDGSEIAICACAHTRFEWKWWKIFGTHNRHTHTGACTHAHEPKRMRVKREKYERQGHHLMHLKRNIGKERDRKKVPQIACNEMKPFEQHLGNENNLTIIEKF